MQTMEKDNKVGWIAFTYFLAQDLIHDRKGKKRPTLNWYEMHNIGFINAPCRKEC